MPGVCLRVQQRIDNPNAPLGDNYPALNRVAPFVRRSGHLAAISRRRTALLRRVFYGQFSSIVFCGGSMLVFIDTLLLFRFLYYFGNSLVAIFTTPCLFRTWGQLCPQQHAQQFATHKTTFWPLRSLSDLGNRSEHGTPGHPLLLRNSPCGRASTNGHDFEAHRSLPASCLTRHLYVPVHRGPTQRKFRGIWAALPPAQ